MYYRTGAVCTLKTCQRVEIFDAKEKKIVWKLFSPFLHPKLRNLEVPPAPDMTISYTGGEKKSVLYFHKIYKVASIIL